ncbi:MAG TPA: galactose-1-epimerase, partial [Bacteroidales bacterium]|nr:galactose-1-epimerase [Bacteroidales bacterium]
MVTSDIKYFTLTNSSGASVTLSNMGAGIISVIVPDKDGNMADVALGYAKPEDY